MLNLRATEVEVALNLNATNIFQGIQTVPSCIPAPLTTNLGYLPNQQQFQVLNFPQSIFINQNYLNPASPFPLAFQPCPIGKGFVYAYSEQANLTFEQDLGGGFALSLAYTSMVGGI
jgi:hypothetical protein